MILTCNHNRKYKKYSQENNAGESTHRTSTQQSNDESKKKQKRLMSGETAAEEVFQPAPQNDGCVQAPEARVGASWLGSSLLTLWRTSAPCTQKITSSAMFVAWSATRSRLRAINNASRDCRTTSGC